jgi:putative oxidoreductase
VTASEANEPRPPAVSRGRAAAGALWVLRAGLSGVLLYAALPKITDLGAFAEQVDNYRMVPAALLPFFSAAVPSVEIVAAAALLTPWLARGAALVCAGLFASFSIAMAQALLRGIDLDCGCFGAEGSSSVSWLTVLRASLLGAFAAYLVFAVGRGPHATAAGARPEND